MDVCVVCGGEISGFEPFWPGLKRCSNCGHCMADIEAEDLDPKAIYGDGYFSGDEYVGYLQDRAVFERQFADRLKHVMRYLASGDLIEIGCAYGFFLAIARKNFCVRGFDIADEPISYAKESLGVDAICGEFLDVPLEPGSADIVVMWDTIEHLPRPDLTVEKAAQVLRPDGFLFLTTGDIGSFWARIRRERWRLIHPPTHLHYFDRTTIARLLETYGLEPLEMQYVGVRRSLRQIAYSLFALGKRYSSWPYRLIANSPAASLSFVLNLYDIMLVVGRKS